MRNNEKLFSISHSLTTLLPTSYSLNYSLSSTQIRKKKYKNFTQRINILKENIQLNNFHKISLHSKLVKSLDKGKFPTEISIRNYLIDKNKLKLPRKLDLEIGNLLLQKYNKDDIYSFTKLSNNISRMKKILKYKVINLKLKNQLINEQKFDLQNSFNLLEEKMDCQKNYIPQFKNYLAFLSKKIDEELEKLYILRNKRNELIMENHKIKIKINHLKEKKELYMNMRNFLICVKEKIIELPKKILDLSNKFDENIDIIKKRDSIFGIRNPFKKQLFYPNMLNKKNNSSSLKELHKTKYFKYLNKSYSIFQSPEEFNEQFREMEIRNLKYVFKLNELLQKIKSLKKELKQINEDNKRYESLFVDDLNKYNYLLFEFKIKNEELLRKMNFLKFHKSENESINKKPKINSLININLYQLKVEKIKKNVIFQKKESYIYYYLYLLFKNIYDISPHLFKNLTKQNYLDRINYLSNPEKFKEEYVRKISKEVLYDFENIITFLQSKLNEIKDKEELNYIKKKIQNNRRIKNGREQRILIQKKKIEKIENYIDDKLKVQNKIRTKFVNMFEINKNKNKTKTHKKTISDINTDINQIFFSE